MRRINEPAPIGAATIPNRRSLDDRLGEVLRRVHRGLELPLWCDLEEHHKVYWRSQVKPFLTILESVGVKVGISE